MMKILVLLVVTVGISQGCRISLDCDDKEGRSLCFEQTCRRDVPCNKDNDCFFYGAADVSHNTPHPKCYDNKAARSPPGYGVCMLKEYAGNLARIPGGDAVDVKQSRDLLQEWFAK